MVKRLRRAVIVAAATASLAAVSATATPAQATVLGCPPGWACIFHGPSWAPLAQRLGVDWKAYNYGTYNLSNQYGWKSVCNQQTGGAVVRLYAGYNGTGQLIATIGADRATNGNSPSCVNQWMDPVNSIKLSRS
jgi:hypothetical protein